MVVLFVILTNSSFAQVDKSRTTTVEFPDQEDEDQIEANPEDSKRKKTLLTTEEIETQLEAKRNRKNVIKLNPLFDYARGYIPVNYERMIIPNKLSIGVGVGPTFKDYLATTGSMGLFPNYADNADYFTTDGTTFAFGLTYDAEVRYFYKSLLDIPSNFSGFFIGLGYNSRIMNYAYESGESYGSSTAFDDKTVINTIRLNTGYSVEYPTAFGVNTYYELNAGIGSRTYNTNITEETITYDNTNGFPLVIDNSRAFNFTKIAFIFNVKFGILF